MSNILVGSCTSDPGGTQELCSAARFNTAEGADVRALYEQGCTAPSTYSNGQCAGAPTYGCCLILQPTTYQGFQTSLYDCKYGSYWDPSHHGGRSYQDDCGLAGGTWSGSPPTLPVP